MRVQQGKPFFCIHPIGGNVFCYAPLARAIGHEYQVLRVAVTRVKWPADVRQPFKKWRGVYIEEYASACSHVGPYRLGRMVNGRCGGL